MNSEEAKYTSYFTQALNAIKNEVQSEKVFAHLLMFFTEKFNTQHSCVRKNLDTVGQTYLEFHHRASTINSNILFPDQKQIKYIIDFDVINEDGNHFQCVCFKGVGYFMFTAEELFSNELLEEIYFFLDLVGKHLDAINVSGIDLQKKKMYERSLQRLQFWESIIDTSKDSVQVSDIHGNMLYANDASCARLGLDKSKITSFTVMDFEPIFPTLIEWENHVNELRSNNGLLMQTINYNKITGEEGYVELSINIVTFHHKEYVLAVARDLHTQKEYKENLLKAKKNAEEANALKDAFVANISHEIRTPLNAIIGLSRELERRISSEQELIGQLKASSSHLLTLINNVLDFSRLNEGTFSIANTSLNLREFVASTIEIMLPIAEDKKLAITYEIRDGVNEIVDFDALNLRQVLINLVGNSIKFTQAGSVNLCVSLLEDRATTQKILFQVIDTGIGINKTFIGQIFDKFSKQNTELLSHNSGTGLGLSISREIIKLMGGDITILSEEGAGTEVRIVLELAKNLEQLEKENDPSNSFDDRFTGLRVLLVDDNLVNSMVAKYSLINKKIDVYIANNGQEAIDFLRENTVDLVFMDIEMPVLNGVEATKQIRKELKLASLPIIALTANTMQNQLDSYLEIGMSDIIIKPYMESCLFTIIQKYVN